MDQSDLSCAQIDPSIQEGGLDLMREALTNRFAMLPDEHSGNRTIDPFSNCRAAAVAGVRRLSETSVGDAMLVAMTNPIAAWASVVQKNRGAALTQFSPVNVRNEPSTPITWLGFRNRKVKANHRGKPTDPLISKWVREKERVLR